MLPTTLEECFVELDKLIDKSELPPIMAAADESIMIGFHSGLGRHIRNEWGFWTKTSELSKWFVGIGIDHPDDMSSIVLKTYWRNKHNVPLAIDELVKFYKDYWSHDLR